jgi:hypothetical protein
MNHRNLNIAFLCLLLGSCATVKELPDPTISCPKVPADFMKPPERAQTIGNAI